MSVIKSSNKLIKDLLQWTLTILRYLSVSLITICLLVVLCDVIRLQGIRLPGIGFVIIYLSVMFFPVTILILGIWIYSFVLSIKRLSKTEKGFFWVHVANMALVIGILLLIIVWN